MSGRILTVIISFIAGAAAVYGYQVVSANLPAPADREGEMRIAEVERQLGALSGRLDEVSVAQKNIDLDADALLSRISILGEKFVKIEKGRDGAKSTEPGTEGGKTPLHDTGTGRSAPEPSTGRRMTGDELAEALKEMPEEGRGLLRRAIREELQRMQEESRPKFETKEELGKKAVASIKSLTAALSLTPIQVEQTRGIVGRQVENILESQRVAKETGDLKYAQTARVKIRHEAERELVDILTPEQMDKLRELDPEGFGKRYPRGFFREI